MNIERISISSTYYLNNPVIHSNQISANLCDVRSKIWYNNPHFYTCKIIQSLTLKCVTPRTRTTPTSTINPTY